MNKDLENFIDKTILDNSLIKINDKLYLKKYQKDILDAYHIAYHTCSDINSLLFLIDEALEESLDIEALEEVSAELQEFQYYNYTNK